MDYELLKNNLKNIPGIEGVLDIITESDFPLKVKVDGYEATISIDGIVTVEGESTGTGETPTPPVSITKTIEELTAGEYVNYVDKNGATIKCMVLYDTNYNTTNGTDYGVQIITADTVEDVEIGNGTGSIQTNNETYFNIARDSYNNAISTLNTTANSYLNTTYASSARCV